MHWSYNVLSLFFCQDLLEKSYMIGLIVWNGIWKMIFITVCSNSFYLSPASAIFILNYIIDLHTEVGVSPYRDHEWINYVESKCPFNIQKTKSILNMCLSISLLFGYWDIINLFYTINCYISRFIIFNFEWIKINFVSPITITIPLIHIWTLKLQQQ